MTIDGGAQNQMSAATEARLQQQSIEAQNQVLDTRAHFLDVAAAQLAILVAHDDFDNGTLLDVRLAREIESPVGGSRKDIEATLTPKELRALPGATVVVNSIFQAATTEIPPTHRQRQIKHRTGR